MTAMIDYLTQLNNLSIFLYLCLGTISISLFAIYLVKLFVPIHIRMQENHIIANTVSLIAVIYGVLAGLTALYLINNNSYTEDTVQHEANAVGNIYRDSKWLKNPAKIRIIQDVQDYLNEVIGVEWPQLKHGQQIKHDVNGSLIIDKITDELVNYTSNSEAQLLLVHDMLDDIRDLSNSREQRIFMSAQRLSAELWLVVILGTILTLCTNYLFGMNIYLHAMTVIAASLMTTSMIFLLITLDRPFQGEFGIEPNAFILVKESVDHYLSTHKTLSTLEVAPPQTKTPKHSLMKTHNNLEKMSRLPRADKFL